MRTLHFYLLRQVVSSLTLTVVVSTLVLLLGNVLKEVLGLLISGQVSGWLVLKSVALLIPFVWVFALPMGMLTATLLTFGRFSADQELTAVRASGVSLLSLIVPILLLSLALSGLSAWVTMDLGPRARVAYKEILREALMQVGGDQLPAGRFIKDFEGYIFYIKENNEGELKDVMVFIEGSTNTASTLNSAKARLTPDPARSQIRLELFDATTVVFDRGEWYVGPQGDCELILDNNRRVKRRSMDISDMTFSQLRSELEVVRARMRGVRWAEREAGELAADEASATLARMETELTTPLRVQMHRMVSFSFACVGFTLIGIPLGIRANRRETNVGIAIGLLLVVAYYSFFILGQSFETDPQYRPHLILWAPNFLFQVVGGLLLWRANRGV